MQLLLIIIQNLSGLSQIYSSTYQHKNDNDRDIRIEAIKKINNKDALTDIAKNDIDPHIRIEAIKKITNQETLKYILKNAINHFSCV